MSLSENDNTYLPILETEFSAGDGSFLIQMRSDLYWDREAFNRLTEAMLQCCQSMQGREQLDRWIAEGFWYLSYYVKDWTTHPNFPHPYPQPYYEVAYERLDRLAYYFFIGESPYQEGHGFEPMSTYILSEGFSRQTTFPLFNSDALE